MVNEKGRALRVFVGVMDIGGYYKALRDGLRELGIKAHSIDLGQNIFKYVETDKSHPLISLYRWSYSYFHKTRHLSRVNPFRYLWTEINLLILGLLLSWICLYFDIIVLKSGIGLTANLFDLRLFRWFRKTVVFIFHGSDSRPPYLNGYWDEHMSEDELSEWTLEIKNQVDRVSPFADYILDNPLSAHFQTGVICVVQCVGNLVDKGKIRAALEKDVRKGERGGSVPGKARILHAPSNQGVKGTQEIRKVINKLKTRGYDIEYIEISNQPNSVVMQEIAKCDLVVDALYSDTYGAMFSMEAAALGKPSFVGGYGREDLDRFVPSEARFPTLYRPPEELEETLVELIENVDYRLKCGRKAKEFARTWAQPKAVAERLLLIASGQAPENWFFDPKDIRYVYGIAGPPHKIARVIKKLLAGKGERALLLDDKPELLTQILLFVQKQTVDGLVGRKDYYTSGL